MTCQALSMPEHLLLFALGWPSISVSVVAILAFVAVVLLLIYGPRKQVAHLKKIDAADYFDAENEARRTLVQIVGGIVVLTGLFFTWINMDSTQRNATEALKLSEKGQVTERFTRAVDQLGKSDEVTTQAGGKSEKATVPNLPARLGGIISLEMIARESEEYHWQIMEILAAYIRRNAPAKEVAPGVTGSSPEPVSLDVAAAITVIGRRYFKRETELQTFDLSHCSLPSVSFRGAALKGASFDRSELPLANFSEANLQSASFNQAALNRAIFNLANLKRAAFPSAQLQGANFGSADLEDVNLIGADLQDADLRGAKVGNVKFDRAILKGARLEGLDLRTAFGLTCQQVSAAVINEQTQLPSDIAEQVRSGRCQ